MNKKVKIGLYVFGIIIFISVGIVTYNYGPIAMLLIKSSFANNKRVEFSTEKWKNAQLYISTDNIRYSMLDDLIKKHKLIGLSKEEVIFLLGENNSEDYFRDWDLKYWLGPETGMGIDSLWLLIKFEDGKVSEYKIMTD